MSTATCPLCGLAFEVIGGPVKYAERDARAVRDEHVAKYCPRRPRVEKWEPANYWRCLHPETGNVYAEASNELQVRMAAANIGGRMEQLWRTAPQQEWRPEQSTFWGDFPLPPPITVRRWLPGNDTPEDPVVVEVERDTLVARARDLGVYDAPEERTDQELADAIAAEEASAEWLATLRSLRTDEQKRDAGRRLAELFRHRPGSEDNPS